MIILCVTFSQDTCVIGIYLFFYNWKDLYFMLTYLTMLMKINKWVHVSVYNDSKFKSICYLQCIYLVFCTSWYIIYKGKFDALICQMYALPTDITYTLQYVDVFNNVFPVWIFLITFYNVE